MKKHIGAMAVIGTLALVTWAAAQSGSNAPFDVKKSQQELAVMNQILNTTLGFVSNELRSGRTVVSTPFGENYSKGSFWSTISSYYLHGQGAVFIIPTSGYRSYGVLAAAKDMEARVFALQSEKAAAAAYSGALSRSLGRGAGAGTGGGVGAGVGGGVAGGVEGGVAGGVAGGVPTQVQPATPKPVQPPADKESTSKRLTELQEKAKQHREQAEKEREKLGELMKQAKGYLIETRANYGDSLTTVKPNEYINLILTADWDGSSYLIGSDEPRVRRDVISVQKSVITDYKAGRINLDAFKQKVLQYQE